MNLNPFLRRRHPAGFSLLLATITTGASLLLLGGVMRWSASNTTSAQRQNQYLGTAAAAEAATETVIGQISKDFQLAQGDRADAAYSIVSKLPTYRQLTPVSLQLVQDLLNILPLPGLLTSPSSPPSPSSPNTWANFEFSDALGQINRTGADSVSNWSYHDLQTKFTGLSGYSTTIRVTAAARQLNSRYQISPAVQRDIQIASIPIFQYQIFYAPDLEIHPSGEVNLSGRVHSNGSIYSERNLTFKSHVTASGKILNYKHPNDPTSRGYGNFTFLGEDGAGVNTLNLPLGTNNSTAILHSIIEVPPTNEITNSLMGAQRYYNKADLIILVSNATCIAKSGAYNGFSVNIPWTNIINTIVATNVSFFNKRENKSVLATEIRIDQLMAKSEYLHSLLGRYVKTVYVADCRPQTTTQSAVSLVNGSTLPPLGLTIATPNPLYVQGDYNAPDAYRGTTNTATTVPASLVADAITILSGNWVHTNSGLALTSRIATNTTVNAALVPGIVPSGGGSYSGGAENAVRLLEDWSGKTLTFNGSLCVLFSSQIATAPWGATAEVYNLPTRKWSFDLNFLSPSKLPPGTPEVRTVIRGKLTTLQANATP